MALLALGRAGASPALAQRPQTLRVPFVRKALRPLRPPDQAHQSAPAPGLLLPGLRPGRRAERPAQATAAAGWHSARPAANLSQAAAVLQQRRLRQQVQAQGAGLLKASLMSQSAVKCVHA